MMQVQYKRQDGSLVALVGGLPYHVTPSDPLYPAAAEAAYQLGATLTFEPVPPLPTEAEVLAAWRATAKASRFQARAALLGAGKLAAAEAAVAGAPPIVQLAWADAVEFRRMSPSILALAPALGLSETDLDDLFIAAALIEA